MPLIDFENRNRRLRPWNAHLPGTRQKPPVTSWRFWFNGRGLANNFCLLIYAGLILSVLDSIEQNRNAKLKTTDEVLTHSQPETKDVFAELNISSAELKSLSEAKNLAEFSPVMKSILGRIADTSSKRDLTVATLINPDSRELKAKYIQVLDFAIELASQNWTIAKDQTELDRGLEIKRSAEVLRKTIEHAAAGKIGTPSLAKALEEFRLVVFK
ncbi:MAG: hypothetical protein R3A13_03880 [Bdellovibrionota bacterium]